MWKPTTDTTSLTKAMDKKSDCLLFDMASDAFIESGSPISLWEWLFVICGDTEFYSAITQLPSEQGHGLSGKGFRYKTGCSTSIFGYGAGCNYSAYNHTYENNGQGSGYGFYDMTMARINMPELPITQPEQHGMLWNNNGTLRIS